jgi:hypothetical protein
MCDPAAQAASVDTYADVGVPTYPAAGKNAAPEGTPLAVNLRAHEIDPACSAGRGKDNHERRPHLSLNPDAGTSEGHDYSRRSARLEGANHSMPGQAATLLATLRFAVFTNVTDDSGQFRNVGRILCDAWPVPTVDRTRPYRGLIELKQGK